MLSILLSLYRYLLSSKRNYYQNFKFWVLYELNTCAGIRQKLYFSLGWSNITSSNFEKKFPPTLIVTIFNYKKISTHCHKKIIGSLSFCRDVIQGWHFNTKITWARKGSNFCTVIFGCPLNIFGLQILSTLIDLL